jgi:phosphatidylserine synthase
MGALEIYRATRKKRDQLFNRYLMRPLAAVLVSLLAATRVTPNQLTLLGAAIFVVAAAMLAGMDGYAGGLYAVAMIELSYLFDCADGMLARHKQVASPQGHLFDFFTDELKATLLVAALGLRAWRGGGYGWDMTRWPAGDVRFLLATIGGLVVVASALSLTTFVRRPEMSGRATPTEAHHEGDDGDQASAVGVGLAAAVMTFLRFASHYPSHIWIFALLGHFEIYFWLYGALHAAYLAKGWLGLGLRFGRS